MIVLEDLQEDGWIGSLGVWRLDPIDQGSCQLIPFVNFVYDYYVGWLAEFGPLSPLAARETKLQETPVEIPQDWQGIILAAGGNDDDFVQADNLFQDVHRSYVAFVLEGQAWQLDQLGRELQQLGALIRQWQEQAGPEPLSSWNSEVEPNSYWWPSWPEFMPPRDQWDTDDLYFQSSGSLLEAWGANLEERAKALEMRPNGAKPGPETAALVCFSTVRAPQGSQTPIFQLALIGAVLWGLFNG